MDPRLQPKAEVYPERPPCGQSKGGDDDKKELRNDPLVPVHIEAGWMLKRVQHDAL